MNAKLDTPDAPDAANDDVLLPCPFCGSSAAMWPYDNKRARVICINESCIPRPAVIGYPHKVAKYWNTRADPATSRLRALEEENRALVDAAENTVIAFGMGWDMEGVIDRLSEVAGVLKS